MPTVKDPKLIEIAVTPGISPPTQKVKLVTNDSSHLSTVWNPSSSKSLKDDLSHNYGQYIPLSPFQKFRVSKSHQLIDMDFTPQKGFNKILDVLQKWPADSVAVRQDGMKNVTYGMFLDFIHKEGDLRKIGVKEKEVVAYICPPGAVGAIVFLTVIAQTCAAPIDRRATMTEIDEMLEQLHVKHFLVFDGILLDDEFRALQKLLDMRDITLTMCTMSNEIAGFYSMEKKDLAEDSCNDPLRTDAEDPVCLLRTSGTTSKPKAVPLHQSGIIQNGLCLAEVIGLQQTDINLNVMPLFHIGGLSCCVLASLCKGASLICMNEFSVEAFLALLGRDKDPPTWYHAVPTVHTLIVQHCKGKAPKNCIRLVRSGAASLQPDIARQLSQLFNCPVHPTYSMSEQMPIVQTPKGYDLSKEGSVGVPNCVSFMIADEKMRPQEWGRQGQVPEGQVCISGPTVMKGYMENPEANKKNFFEYDGKKWFCTGDVGVLDEDGHLFLRGRSKEVIKVNGEQVSPFEVEECIMKLPFIKCAVCYSIPSASSDEEVGVAVVLTDVFKGQDVSKLVRNHCLKSLTFFKVPTVVVILESTDIIPKTRTKKYKRIGLHAYLQEEDRRVRMTETTPISPASQGAGFLMSVYIVFNHVGAENMGDFGFGNLIKARTMYMHVMLFIMLGGLNMAATLRGYEIVNFRAWYLSTFAGLYPPYIFGFFLAMIHWFTHCNDSDDFPEFSYYPETRCMEPYADLSYGVSTFTTILAYITGLQSYPGVIYIINFIYPYSWFMSIYFLLVLLFPFIYNQFARDPWNAPWHCLKIAIAELIIIVIGLLYYTCDSFECKTHFTMHYWLMPIFWIPLFSAGIGIYFMLKYVHTFYREWNHPNLWDGITDGCSFIMVLMLIFLITSRKQFGFEQETNDIFPRWWGIQMTHFFTPLLVAWLYGLCIGSGYVARFCSSDPMIKIAKYNFGVFLFHDSVASWWLLITRGKQLNQSRPYWFFTPQPGDVAWPEYIAIVCCVTLFSWFYTSYINPSLFQIFIKCTSCLVDKRRASDMKRSILAQVIDTYELLYGTKICAKDVLSEFAADSIRDKQLIQRLNNIFQVDNVELQFMDVHKIKVKQGTVEDVAKLIAKRLKENQDKEDQRTAFALGDATFRGSDTGFQRGDELRKIQTARDEWIETSDEVERIDGTIRRSTTKRGTLRKDGTIRSSKSRHGTPRMRGVVSRSRFSSIRSCGSDSAFTPGDRFTDRGSRVNLFSGVCHPMAMMAEESNASNFTDSLEMFAEPSALAMDEMLSMCRSSPPKNLTDTQRMRPQYRQFMNSLLDLKSMKSQSQSRSQASNIVENLLDKKSKSQSQASNIVGNLQDKTSKSQSLEMRDLETGIQSLV